MSNSLSRIPVGVLVERRKATSQWADYLWRPASVLVGEPDARPWTVVSQTGDSAMFYAGRAEIEFHQAETAHYRDNLAAGPSLWVVLRSTGAEPPYELAKVTADPYEGEAYAEAGAGIVEPVPMPDSVRDFIAAFIAEHHVEQPFVKRARKRADPEAMARGGPQQHHGDESER